MSDRHVTLFALHTHGDVQMGPATVPGIGGDEGETDVEEADVAVDDEASGNAAARALLGLVVLVAAAAAVRRFRGGDAGPEVPLEESDEIAPTQD